MRFAGQRFRASKARNPDFRAQDGSIGDFRYSYFPSGVAPSRASMPEVNASNFSKIGEPNFQEPAFIEPEFRT